MRLMLALAAAALCSTPALADDCAAEIKAIMTAATNAGPLHMESVITTNGADMVMSGDMIPPTDVHEKMTAGDAVTEMVQLGGRAWMNSSGTWTEVPPETAAVMSGFSMNVGATQLDSMTNARCDDTVRLGDRDLVRYSFSIDGADTSSTARVFVDPAQKLPVRIESDIAAPGVTINMWVDYTYDATIRIVAPI